MEIALNVDISYLVPDELVVDSPDYGMVILKLLNGTNGENVVVCPEGQEPAGLMCGKWNTESRNVVFQLSWLLPSVFLINILKRVAE